MLSVKNLSFSFGGKPLYKGVNFVVGKGQKVGLTGPNGSGKSTLLALILGREEPSEGNIKVQGQIGYVPQEIKHDPRMEDSLSVRDYVDPGSNYLDYEIKKMFKGLEITAALDADPKTLSGGQKTKLALAKALLEKPDLILLDEPTNFMDTKGKKWVMDFLSSYEGSVIVISHDLKLMDVSIDKILAVNPHDSSVKEYTGTYSNYLKLKEDYERKLKREIEVKSRHLKRMEEGYKTLGQFDTKRTVWRHKIEKERAALPEAPSEIRNIKFSLPEPGRVGEIPLKALNVNKSYGERQVLKDLNFTVYRGERIALIGPNGMGKSTLIKILLGMVTPDSGSVVMVPELKIGYYSQEFETFDFEKTVLSAFCEKTEKTESYARGFLGKFLITNQKVYQKVRSLSGGEKTRLSIAILTAQGNNLLILDEPTTYLDVMSQRIILESLKEYSGTMIFVSHTPEFVKELKPVKAFLFPEQKMVYWDDEILDKVEEL